MESNDISRQIGQRLTLARRLRDLTVEDLAAAANLKPHRLQRYEAGDHRLTADELIALAVKLSLPVGFFVGESHWDGCCLCGQVSSSIKFKSHFHFPRN
jgi:hypothetical protein